MVGLLYFAYGSNLHPRRLRQRVGDVALVSVGELAGAELTFHKVGRDGSGKCSFVEAGREGARVLGAVYRLTQDQARSLDGFEAVGRGYERRDVRIRVASGDELRCFTYVAMGEHVDEGCRPFAWYRDLVWIGARHHGFPREYLAALASQATRSRRPVPRRLGPRRL